MLNKVIHFLKYNNAAVIILALILILGGGALAAGPEAIGQKQTSLQGMDNSLLLSADLDNLSLDFKIDKIEQDDNYYYVNYSYLDLAVINSAWQYQLTATSRKISKKLKEDLGEYLAKQLAKHYEARVRELKQAKTLAESAGLSARVEVTAYSGLIGKTLDAVKAVFPGYEPVKKREIAAPENTIPLTPFIKGEESGESNGADNLTQIYNDYVAEHPEIFNPPTPLSEGGMDATSTPAIEATSTPAQADATSTPPTTPLSGVEPAPAPADSVQVIELPAPPSPASAPEPAPASAEPEPAPAAEITTPMP